MTISTEPAVSRVLLRVELADGQFREFVAQDPYDVELTVTRPDAFIGLPAIPLPPAYITGGEATSVTVELKASRSLRRREPITISTNEDAGEHCTRCGAASAFWQPQQREAI